MLSWIPNCITLSNLICGCLGLIFLHQGNINLAGWMVLGGVFFDFFDGMVARMLKVSSELGKQLDSLADLVSFGILPSMIMYNLLSRTTSYTILPFYALLIAALSALRLAIFNISTEQSNKFIGIPTTAYGTFISSLAIRFGITKFLFLQSILESPYFLVGIVLLSFLLVAKIPFLAFKFKNFSWKSNWPRFVMMIIFFFNLTFSQIEGITFSLLIYILFGCLLQYCMRTYCEKES
jgi:CDP-diacylglycerol--serine O-phosphatidyltransferase